MSQITVNDLTFSYEGSFDTIFDHASFSIDTDWRLGFIGRNGKGKTTLLNLLLGRYSYSGTIISPKTFDYFPYAITDSQMLLPASDFVDKLKPSCELWHVLRELDHLQESPETLYRPFGTLSPGERTKILLAVLFSGENDFLLIDEPTSHLDQASRENVKNYLSSKKGFILVSHDRDLLDTCVNHILALNRQNIEVQNGNFSSWWENRQRKDHFALAENEKHLKEIGKLRQSADRASRWAVKNENTKIGVDPIQDHDRGNGTRPYIGAKTKKMQRRVKQLQNRIGQEIREKEGLLVDLEQVADLKLTPLLHHKKTLISLRDYGVAYPGACKPVFTGLTFSLSQGDRIALHGENGCGKSTLIKMLLQKSGFTDPDLPVTETGNCTTAPGLAISYINQDTSGLKGNISDFCRKRCLDKSLFCSILRQLGVERIQLAKNIEEYSEGQKRKTLLAAGLLTPAHLYIWDEPLNYMDIFSRMQVEKLLLEYRPTMLFVEHDARFRDTIATNVIRF